ncbi:MAG TPA: glycosyltransferase [Gammaproteobacteria bacterium]
MAIDYSVVIPAYNEADWLPKTIAALDEAMKQSQLQGEIIVCNNNSTDSTASCAEELGARVVFESYNQISRARNTGARHAQGRYLIFVDADTLISGALLSEALGRLQSGHYIGGGAVVIFDSPLSTAAELGSRMWNWLSVKQSLAAGSFVFCLREAFEAVNGFSEAVYASEEIWLSRRLRKLGKQRGQIFAIIESWPVISSGRKMQWYGTWQQILLLLMLMLFPFMVRFRRLCGFWYQRPER